MAVVRQATVSLSVTTATAAAAAAAAAPPAPTPCLIPRALALWFPVRYGGRPGAVCRADLDPTCIVWSHIVVRSMPVGGI